MPFSEYHTAFLEIWVTGLLVLSMSDSVQSGKKSVRYLHAPSISKINILFLEFWNTYIFNPMCRRDSIIKLVLRCQLDREIVHQLRNPSLYLTWTSAIFPVQKTWRKVVYKETRKQISIVFVLFLGRFFL